MKVCFICRCCYDDTVLSCVKGCVEALSDHKPGSVQMVPGYQLETLIDSGRNGDTYHAVHVESHQSCSITINSADEQYSQQFLSEAALAATLFSENIAEVYESGRLATGDVFAVTQDVDGQTLREHLAATPVPELLTTVAIVRQAAEALHAAHVQGFAHRAVNPENIILTKDDAGDLLVKICNFDFGGVREHSIVSNKFLIDTAIDSFKYFAPEQCTGQSEGARSDVYSLGIVFYEMLSGSVPFDDVKAAGLINAHKNQQPPSIVVDDFDLRMLVTHAVTESLNKQPATRQSSANALARQLRHIEQLAAHSSTPPAANAPVREIVEYYAPSVKRPPTMIQLPEEIYQEDASAVIAASTPAPAPVVPQPVPVPVPAPAQVAAAVMQRESFQAAPAAFTAKPKLITFELPDEDIPSIEEVMEVRAKENLPAIEFEEPRAMPVDDVIVPQIGPAPVAATLESPVVVIPDPVTAWSAVTTQQLPANRPLRRPASTALGFATAFYPEAPAAGVALRRVVAAGVFAAAVIGSFMAGNLISGDRSRAESPTVSAVSKPLMPESAPPPNHANHEALRNDSKRTARYDAKATASDKTVRTDDRLDEKKTYTPPQPDRTRPSRAYRGVKSMRVTPEKTITIWIPTPRPITIERPRTSSIAVNRVDPGYKSGLTRPRIVSNPRP